MRRLLVLCAIQAVAVSAMLLADVPGAFARGGGGQAGFGSGGFGSGGLGHGGFGRGGRGVVRIGRSHGFDGRIVAGRRRGYFPAGGYGGFGYGFGDGGFYSNGAAGFRYEPAARTENIYSRSVVIRRGPAFGEPGYVAHPAIYHITQDRPAKSGTRRFKVERMDF